MLCVALTLSCLTSLPARADVSDPEPPPPDSSPVAADAETVAETETEAPTGTEKTPKTRTFPWLPTRAPKAVKPPPPLPPFQHDPKRTLKFDWVQIESGEWLKGEIVRMHRHKFYFDSDEFDEVSFDWEDVLTLVSKDIITIRVEDAESVTARIGLRNKVARMYGAEGFQDVPQHQILGMISGAPRERNYWSGSASIGISARAGNTEQADFTMRASLVRQTEMTRWRSSYTGEISTVTGDQTANSHRVPSQFDVYLTRRLFLTTPLFEYFTDKFSNVSSRITPGAGVGYELVDNSWVYWEVSSGLAYQYTNYVSVTDGDDDVDHDAAILLRTKLDFDLRYGIEWDNLYTLQVVVTDPDKTSHHAESELSFDIWGPLEFEVSFIFDRIEKPVEDSNGDRPLSNDYRLTAGLGVDF
jgi:hypothetical protein